MDYSMLIQDRKSVRTFSSKKVSASAIAEIEAYYNAGAQRLFPEIRTELRMFGKDKQKELEGAAGYNDFLIGAPQYLVLLSADAPQAGINAGYLMEDLILKLVDMGLGSCWLTFTDSSAVKEALGIKSDLSVAALAAFGHAERAKKRIRLNIRSMSNVDVSAQRHFYDPKRSVDDMVFMDVWGKKDGVDDFIGFYNDMLWEAFYAASLSPSYLNRQPYGFVISGKTLTLVKRPDEYTTVIDGALDLGIVLLHFTSVISRWHPALSWSFGADAPALPEGYTAVCSCSL